MPQMMPLNWMFMFIQLTTIISLTMITLFFIYTPTPPNQQPHSYTTQTTWKW